MSRRTHEPRTWLVGIWGDSKRAAEDDNDNDRFYWAGKGWFYHEAAKGACVYRAAAERVVPGIRVGGARELDSGQMDALAKLLASR